MPVVGEFVCFTVDLVCAGVGNGAVTTSGCSSSSQELDFDFDGAGAPVVASTAVVIIGDP